MVMEFMAGSLWDLLHKAHDVRFDWKLIMSLISGTAKGMVESAFQKRIMLTNVFLC